MAFWPPARLMSLPSISIEYLSMTFSAVAASARFAICHCDYLLFILPGVRTQSGARHNPRAPVHMHFFTNVWIERGLVFFLNQLLIERCRATLARFHEPSFPHPPSIAACSVRPTHHQYPCQVVNSKIHDRERHLDRSIGAVANLLVIGLVLHPLRLASVLKC